MNQVTEDSFEKGSMALLNRVPAVRLEDYLALVKYLTDNWKSDSVWFRGVSNSDYSLIPSIYRDDAYSRWKYETEVANQLFDEFVLKARSFFLQVRQEYEPWEWYHLMQHYGLPTRLLDWTAGSLMGLYFAVRNIEDTVSPAVWVMDAFWLNSQSAGVETVFYSDVARQAPEDLIANQYIRDQDSLPKWPIAIFPPYIDERLRVQRSRFTVHGSQKDGFSNMYQQDESPRLALIRVQPDSVESIKDFLVATGIGESTLFPDLEGLAREMKFEYGLYKLPNLGPVDAIQAGRP